MDKLSEFIEKGFIQSDSNFRRILRHRGELFRTFKSGIFNCRCRNPKYASYEIFGDSNLIYYYDTRREQEFIDFLVEKFYDRNPNPNREMKAQFTRILHHHKLCWHGCHHSGKKRLRDEKLYKEEVNKAVNNRRDINEIRVSSRIRCD